MNLTRETPSYQEFRITRAHVLEAGTRMLIDRTGQRLIFEYREDPKPTLRFYPDARGRATASISLNGNGTIHPQGPGKVVKLHPVLWNNIIEGWILENLEAELLSWLIRKPPTPGILQLLTRAESSYGLREDMRMTARTAMDHCFQTAIRNGAEVPNPQKRTNNQLKGIIQSKFIRKEYSELCLGHSSWYQDQDPIRAYNQAALNHRVFQQVKQDSKHVLQFYQLATISQTGPPHKLSSADELTRRVQEMSGLDGAAWRCFTRVGWNAIWNADQQQEMEELQMGFNALAEANRPQAPDTAIRMVAGETANHRFFRNAQWRHGDPWAAWVHLINQNLGEHPPGPHGLDPRGELRNVADALRWHIEHEQPWGLTDWESYVRRSDRWHREISMRNQREMDDAIRTASWTSTLGPVQLKDISASPVNTATHLHDLGREMNNCLGTYWKKCLEGTDRIFSIWKEKKLLAAGQITRRGDGWTVGQVEGPGRNRPSQEARAAMRRVCTMYEEAERKEQR